MTVEYTAIGLAVVLAAVSLVLGYRLGYSQGDEFRRTHLLIEPPSNDIYDAVDAMNCMKNGIIHLPAHTYNLDRPLEIKGNETIFEGYQP